MVANGITRVELQGNSMTRMRPGWIADWDQPMGDSAMAALREGQFQPSLDWSKIFGGLKSVKHVCNGSTFVVYSVLTCFNPILLTFAMAFFHHFFHIFPIFTRNTCDMRRVVGVSEVRG